MKSIRKKASQTSQEKVDERRKEVLARGRKFKYPLQWAKHRVVINTLLITVIVIAMVVVGLWLALYRLNMTDDFLFRLTRLIPVPVADVEGEPVRFSDYLMLYRSSMTSIERQSGSQFDENSLQNLQSEYKKTALSDAEKYTYALKLAKELDINVSDEEVAEEFTRHLGLGGVERSEEAFVKIVENNFGLSKSEYERLLYLSLVKSKVSIKIDEKAEKLAEKVEKMLAENDNDYSAVAEALGDKIVYQETGGLVDTQNIDGGRANEAMKLEPGQSSGKFISMNGDGYYFVKLIEKTETEVDFVSIKVPFTELNEQFDKLGEENKINVYIEIPEPVMENAEGNDEGVEE